MARLELKVEELLNSEFGEGMLKTINSLEDYLRFGNTGAAAQSLLEKWFAYKSALKYMFDIDYAFTRESKPCSIINTADKSYIRSYEHYGIVNEADESDWLYYAEV